MKVRKSEIKLGIKSRANFMFEFAVIKLTDEETLQQKLPKQAAMSNPDVNGRHELSKTVSLTFLMSFLRSPPLQI